MLIVNALKTVCDLLLFFSFLSLFASFREAWQLIGAVLALTFLSSLIVQKAKGVLPARILCALLPALGLFAARSLPEVVITAVVLAFYAVLMIFGRNGIDYEDYKFWFGIPAVPVLVLFVICFTQWPIRPASTVCAAAYLFLGVLVLRRKRMGAGANLKLRLVNLTELTGAVAFSLLACTLLYAVIRASRKVLMALLVPFGWLINALALFFEWITERMATQLPDETLIPEETESLIPEDFTAAETITADSPKEISYTPVDTLIYVIAIILALAVFAYLLYRFYKLVRNVRPEGSGADATIEEGEEAAVEFSRRRRKRNKLSVPSNNEKIRMIYKEYLLFLKTCGIEVTRQTTSADILEASTRLSVPDEAKRLRELYIRARYHHLEKMTNEEVDEAKKLLAFIQEQAVLADDDRKAAAMAGGKTAS